MVYVSPLLVYPQEFCQDSLTVFNYNCSGDYRDARALIGRRLRHILL